MRRKVVKHGQNTLIVSIPAKWAKDNNINKGDEIELEEEKNKLIMSSLSIPKLIKASIDTDEFSFSVVRGLAALYQTGCDEVNLKFNDPEMMKQVQDYITNLLPGYEIINQHINRCTVRNISIGLNTEFEPLLRRYFMVTLQMADNFLDLINKKDFKGLNDLLILEKTNNKFANLCIRLLNKKGAKERSKSCFLYSIISDFERIADEYEYMSKYIIRNKKNFEINASTIKHLTKVNEMLRLFYELFYKFERNKSHLVTEYRENIIADFNNAKDSEINQRMMHYLVNIAQFVFDSFGSLLCMKLIEE